MNLYLEELNCLHTKHSCLLVYAEDLYCQRLSNTIVFLNNYLGIHCSQLTKCFQLFESSNIAVRMLAFANTSARLLFEQTNPILDISFT